MEYLNKVMEKRLKEIQNLNGEISQARINLKEFITRYFSDLSRQVADTSLETFNDFVKREIGDEGINIIQESKMHLKEKRKGFSMKSLKLERVLMPIGVFLKNMPEHSGKLGMTS
ncbi:labile enterotoxin outputA [Helicobacter pylori]|nr:labile enterotoxin outputA [Helicobacter pylori]BAW60916.1 labile enterotoxin outputA [Helicobacter pylori]